ncbi:ABC transporter permease subunit [Actinomycetes bacterium KLBMP 9797]
MRRALRFAPVAVVTAGTLAGPVFAPRRIDEPVTAPYAAPSADAWLGGDQLGRDVLSRVFAGGQELLITATFIAVVVTALAAVAGAVAALRPAVGRIVERAADTVMLVPTVLALLLVVLAYRGSSRGALIVAAVVLGLPYAIRVVAAAAAPVASAGFIEAAAASGERLWWLACREVLPNLRATLLAVFGLRFIEAVYVVSVAAFLQIGPRPPAANWALMVRENGPGILLNPWAVVAPSLAIATVAVAVGFATDALTAATRARTVVPR